MFRNETVAGKADGQEAFQSSWMLIVSWKGACLQETGLLQVTTGLFILSQDKAKLPATDFKP